MSSDNILVFSGNANRPLAQAVCRELGVPMNTKVDVYLEFENREGAGLGIPLPAGRMRVSQLDAADESRRFVAAAT